MRVYSFLCLASMNKNNLILRPKLSSHMIIPTISEFPFYVDFLFFFPEKIKVEKS